ncbi:replication restart helicase PriA [Heliophilum fasciatum]|uniref:Replication restart protein PriA n=1 Tax=Heliophilum fasciatum TaxID=35700 RepID=A0A4R2SAB1_9FIRM|nr:primosomal protein N' [Heliophilum fasciatum]MCW2277210.1 primosomal protein N' (replication factor Y) [Heliophilum fasciatum]TCP68155.1 replication restart DNA helicase PriA [Heliophilum fasciatum]
MPETSQERYVQVLIDQPLPELDRLFHYRVPDGWDVPLGQQVWVPFNRKLIAGWVWALDDRPPENVSTVQFLAAVDRHVRVPDDVRQLVDWMAHRYQCTRTEALHPCLPPGPRQRPSRWVMLQGTMTTEERASWGGIDPDAAAIIARLSRAAHRQMRLTTLLQPDRQAQTAAIERLIRAGWVKLEWQLPRERPPIEHKTGQREQTPSPWPPLTAEQARICEHLATASGPVLLHGVTGSGKTEVYLHSAREVLARGQRVLYLVPEIGLTPQAGARWTERFADYSVLLLHSGLKDRERHGAWHRIASGQVDVVIGARSALLAPIDRLGLIVVDEEHEPSYIQDQDPKYDAREVALFRAHQQGALVIMGSATPSLEAYWQAGMGRLQLLTMRERVTGAALPPVTMVDMRAELAAGRRGVLSQQLREAIDQRLQRGEQSLLYLNRRGFSTFVLCRECGEVLTCPHCAVSLVYHRAAQVLRCHYCQHRQAVPKQCPHCHSEAIRYFGTGTQRIETELLQHFPSARVLRMDRDTADSHGVEQVLNQFARREGDILVGTQMIAKGLDFPAVTLVGVLAADLSLHVPEFRAAERTMQLLTQVAGRAGRSKQPGEVIMQTYCPEHYCLQAVENHDYVGFYRREISIRQHLGYPPFSYLARVLFTGLVEAEVAMAAETWAERLRDQAKSIGPLEVWGPAVDGIAKLEDRHRRVLTVRWQGIDAEPLRAALQATNQAYRRLRGRPAAVTVSVAIDSAAEPRVYPPLDKAFQS